MRLKSLLLVLALIAFVSCSDEKIVSRDTGTSNISSLTAEERLNIDNPFFRESQLQFHYPEFDLINNEHYLPAFNFGMEEHLREIQEIANQADSPTFENTIIL